MLSFIRKRLPSKDQTNEHLQNVKYRDDQIKRAQSADQLDVNNNNEDKKKKKKKKKEKCLSTLSDSSSPIGQINQSYSDVDYFPMMPGALSQLINRQETSRNSDSLSDCYLNPSESLQTINGLNYIQTGEMKTRVFQIPVIDCRKEQRVMDYKDVDHQRTKALREVTEQRTRQKSVK